MKPQTNARTELIASLARDAAAETWGEIVGDQLTEECKRELCDTIQTLLADLDSDAAALLFVPHDGDNERTAYIPDSPEALKAVPDYCEITDFSPFAGYNLASVQRVMQTIHDAATQQLISESEASP